MSFVFTSPHKYGCIGIPDAVFMDSVLLRVSTEFSQRVKFLEIGVSGGWTACGIQKWCDEHGATLEYHGIDLGDPQVPLPPGAVFIKGDSTQVFCAVPCGFNILFIDGCHCVNHSMLDFLHYSPKIVVGGYVLFHDANPKPTWQGLHYQGHGPDIPSFRIAVREALLKLGLETGMRRDWEFIGEESTDAGLGMALYRRVV
jgi:hypothetical protein